VTKQIFIFNIRDAEALEFLKPPASGGLQMKASDLQPPASDLIYYLVYKYTRNPKN
jgi:hypothetical protein